MTDAAEALLIELVGPRDICRSYQGLKRDLSEVLSRSLEPGESLLTHVWVEGHPNGEWVFYAATAVAKNGALVSQDTWNHWDQATVDVVLKSANPRRFPRTKKEWEETLPVLYPAWAAEKNARRGFHVYHVRQGPDAS